MPWTREMTRNGTARLGPDRLGWLALAVVLILTLHHFQAEAPTPLAQAIHPVFDSSGYLLLNALLILAGWGAASLWRPGEGGPVLVGRALARVLPGHLIVLGGLAVLVMAAGAVGAALSPTWFDWSQLPAQASLTQSLGAPGGFGWNAPSWILSAVLPCLLLTPVLIGALGRLAPWTGVMIAVAAYAVLDLISVAWTGTPLGRLAFPLGAIRALPLFALGLALALAAERAPVTRREAALALTLGGAGLILWQGAGPAVSLGPLFFALIAVGVGATAGVRTVAASRKAPLILALFLTNEPVRIAWAGASRILMERLSLSAPLQWALWSAGLVAAVAVGLLFERWIDRPLQAGLARLAARRRAPDGGVLAEREG